MERLERRLAIFVTFLAALMAGCSSAASEPSLEKSEAVCSSATVTSDHPSLSAVPGDIVNWTASPACTGTAQYQFWLISPSHSVSLAQDWSTTKTYAWNTTGLAVGTWELQVWVRDVPSGPLQVYADSYFNLASTQPCNAINSAISPTSGVVGDIATITSSASPCAAAEYLIGHRAPGGSWNVDSQYSASNNSYVFNTAGQPPGLHEFQVWVRNQGSQASYQAYKSLTYVLNAGTPCGTVTVSFSPVGHSPAGTAVTISVSAAGCSNPQFAFWYQPPSGGAYQQLQPYTSSSQIVWNTNGDQAGLYNFQVLARQTGNPSSYESYRSTSYVIDASTTNNAFAISSGWASTCQLSSNGKVDCWGYGANGQMGNGSTSEKNPSPVAVTGISTGISLSAGYGHFCAVLGNNTVQCWGSNLHGQIGDGTTNTALAPVTVSSLSSVVSVAAGNSHNCAVIADGTMKCWGYNSQGQLGNGVKGGDGTVPVSVVGITDAVQASAGYYHSCALSRSGTVKCWGLNTIGELGDGTGVSSNTPVSVSGLTNVKAISGNSTNQCALKNDGTIWCWGQNSQYGTLGNGNGNTQFAPVQVSGITNATSVTVGVYHSCAVLQGGSVRCWGYNAYGQLGDNTTSDSFAPVQVSNITNAVSVGIGNYTTCATLTDGTASCWGYGVLGSLGNGGTVNSSIPVAVGTLP